MPRSLFGGLLLASLACGACGAPSSFDGVTGGSKGNTTPVIATQPQVNEPATTITQDENLAAPRQLSPLSASLVSTSRPRFMWTYGDGGSDAVVELSQTHDFKGTLKKYPVHGKELAITEDLTPGVWFWRLKGATSASIGITPSPVWEVVVRGPAAHGSSDTPSRAIIDMNGDGEPDLLVAETLIDMGATGGDAGADPTPFPIIQVMPGGKDHFVVTDGHDGIGGWGTVYAGPVSIGGSDLDGDGLTDMIEAGGLDTYEDGATTRFNPSVNYAAPYGSAFILDGLRSGDLYTGPAGTLLPHVSGAGDVDGDGYGDAVVGLDNLSFVALGSLPAKAFTPLAMLSIGDASGEPASGHTRAALGGFDANGDGLADVMFSYTDPTRSGAFVAAGDRGLRVAPPTTILNAVSAPTAVAAGDFNGDGIDDVAFTVTAGTTTQVCISYGDRSKMLIAGACTSAPAGETDFGLSLTAVDLEGDGVDELLATSKTSASGYGVRLLRATGSVLVTTAISTPPGVGLRLTTLWPGRPGKARWAAAAADGSHVEVYEGDALWQRVEGDRGATGFGRGLR